LISATFNDLNVNLNVLKFRIKQINKNPVGILREPLYLSYIFQTAHFHTKYPKIVV